VVFDVVTQVGLVGDAYGAEALPEHRVVQFPALRAFRAGRLADVFGERVASVPGLRCLEFVRGGDRVAADLLKAEFAGELVSNIDDSFVDTLGDQHAAIPADAVEHDVDVAVGGVVVGGE
jgi:hypothetical protein